MKAPVPSKSVIPALQTAHGVFLAGRVVKKMLQKLIYTERN